MNLSCPAVGKAEWERRAASADDTARGRAYWNVTGAVTVMVVGYVG